MGTSKNKRRFNESCDMSAVFYGYKIPKDKLYAELDAIRLAYSNEHYIGKLAEQLMASENPLLAAKEFHDKLESSTTRLKDEFLVELQLFEFDSHWIFRFLECGFLHQHIYKDNDQLVAEEFYFDSRTDLSKKERERESEILAIDEMIRNKHYFITPIISTKDLMSMVIDKVFEKRGLPLD